MNLREAQKLCIDGKKIKSTWLEDSYVHFDGISFIWSGNGKIVENVFNNFKDDTWRVVEEKKVKKVKITYDILNNNDGWDVETGFNSRKEAERAIILLPLSKYGVCKSYNVVEE